MGFDQFALPDDVTAHGGPPAGVRGGNKRTCDRAPSSPGRVPSYCYSLTYTDPFSLLACYMAHNVSPPPPPRDRSNIERVRYRHLETSSHSFFFLASYHLCRTKLNLSIPCVNDDVGLDLLMMAVR